MNPTVQPGTVTHEMAHLAIDSPLTEHEHGPNPSNNPYFYDNLLGIINEMKKQCDQDKNFDLDKAWKREDIE